MLRTIGELMDDLGHLKRYVQAVGDLRKVYMHRIARNAGMKEDNLIFFENDLMKNPFYRKSYKEALKYFPRGHTPSDPKKLKEDATLFGETDPKNFRR